MSNNIVLKKGLNIPLAGVPRLAVKRTVTPVTVAVQPSDYKGLNARLLVREGDKVLAGSPVLADKKNPDVLVTSPVSGTVKEVVRGDKRKLLAVLVDADKDQEYLDFGAAGSALTAEEVKDKLLKSGLWAAFIQRPYGILADPAVKPKAIFVSAFSTAPLAADTEFTLGNDTAVLQAGVSALAKLAKVHVSVKSADSAFARLSDAEIHVVKGKHPAGNVGVQISHICPIRKDETVWTVSLALLAAIGRLFTTGRYDVRRKVAVGGPATNGPAYIDTLPGIPMDTLKEFYVDADGIRIISGDVLSGRNVGENGYLGFYDTQVTVLKEGTEPELLGWARPFRFNQYSADHSYFNWCLGRLDKEVAMDTNLHGGPRAFVMPDSYYGKYFPMDVYPLYLVKACLAGDIDNMEKYGIYEVLPEDFALVEFMDPSKNYVQDIIEKGIDLMLKEMA
ncbi:MAG: Na(+)-translocating NADH-quinone reductase subunit A [Bacteroidales bacterium]|jgi:Na+-transporting NADH:ubiquinone oxidoreductase subunit A|nr:Na(+)-translocating NADH-quinone reductase subunit A [Bacteroidales bacterium]